MKAKVSVVKVGGNLIADEKVMDQFLSNFAKVEGAKVLVHGGGKLATQLANQLGLETKIIDGRRITDRETLNVITMVYGGLVSKTIVAKLQAHNCNALGLSGADLNLIESVKRPIKEWDYGFVGDVKQVNSEMISLLLENHIIPVVCAITHDKNGQLLNTNADTIASEIAIGLSAFFETSLYYCFEKNGVLSDVNDEDSVIPKIDSTTYDSLLKKKIIAEGMLPKLHNCFYALERKVAKVYIGSIKMMDPTHTLKTTITL